jgi:hypothetical protein
MLFQGHISITYAIVIRDFVITTFHYVFSTTCDHSHHTTLMFDH